jgi:phosphopantetheinyl transferase
MVPLVLLAVNVAKWSSKEVGITFLYCFTEFFPSNLSLSQLELGLQHLPAEEHGSILRYRLKEDRHRALASQLLRRYLFAKYLEIPWAQLTFETSEFGKPRLVC